LKLASINIQNLTLEESNKRRNEYEKINNPF
jgi:hypothetical protein